MRVFRIKPDVNHYQYFLTDQDADAMKLVMDGTPRLETWQPPPVFVLKPLHKQGDFYQFNSGILITSPRATEVLRTHLEMAGELLPLPHAGQIYTVLNVTECINCLNQEKSEWLSYKSGERGHLTRYVFHENRFTASTIFKIPETRGAEIFIVEGLGETEHEFRELVQSAGLEGLIFEEVWTNEP